ncbi:MAG: hypothetical protein Q9187_004754 [Circinaria calcarea]
MVIYSHSAKSGDVTYEGVNEGIWVGLEPTIGIIAGTIPTLRPLFRSCASKRKNGGHLIDDSPMQRPNHRTATEAFLFTDSSHTIRVPGGPFSDPRTPDSPTSGSEQSMTVPLHDPDEIRKTTEIRLSTFQEPPP